MAELFIRRGIASILKEAPRRSTDLKAACDLFLQEKKKLDIEKAYKVYIHHPNIALKYAI